MVRVQIQQENGRVSDANAELEDGVITLHSRGGTGRHSRNSEYSIALVDILGRLLASGERAEVFLDSIPAKRFPKFKRTLVLKSEFSGPVQELVSIIRRRMRDFGKTPTEAGSGNSTKRIRIETGLPAARLQEVVHALTPKTNERVAPLTTEQLRTVQFSHVHRAVERMISGEDSPNFGESRDYVLITPGGQRLAPKKVFGLALEEALSIEVHPGHFSAGWGKPCFEILSSAGFEIVRKEEAFNSPTRAAIAAALRSVPQTDEDREWSEGNPKVVRHLQRERASGLAAKKKAAFIEAYGRLFCERCSFDPVSIYGEQFGSSCIEVHHTVPLSEMVEGHRTTLAELQCLCANCHRVTHRELATLHP